MARDKDKDKERAGEGQDGVTMEESSQPGCTTMASTS